VAEVVRNGVRLHYEVAGRGFPLVLVPGVTLDGSFWRMAGYVDRLSSDFCCVLVDPRGMGQSSRPAGLDGYAIGETAADVLAIADDLGFSQFAYWGGSQGGSVGLVLAVEQPQRLACLVLSGAWLDYAPDRPGRAEFARYVRECGDPGAVVREMCNEEGVPASHWIRSIHHGDSPVVAALLEGWLAYDWEGRAAPPQVTVPTLMIVGELEDPGREAEAVAEAMPHAQAVTLSAVGHIGVQLAVHDSLAHARPFLARCASSQLT
jgi:pimeloyl-ACP methyl ester carboxylesterase